MNNVARLFSWKIFFVLVLETDLLDFFCLKEPRFLKDKRITPSSISAWDVKSTGVNEILTTTVDCNCCPVLISSTFYLVVAGSGLVSRTPLI